VQVQVQDDVLVDAPPSRQDLGVRGAIVGLDQPPTVKCHMDGVRFDSLVTGLASRRPRRVALSLLAALGLGLTQRAASRAATSGTCKPKCGECQRCKKGDCERKHGTKVCKKGKCKPKPIGTPCTGGTCQNGQCIAPDGSVVTPPAGEPTGDPTGGTPGDPPLSSCIPVCPRLQTCTSTGQCPPGTQCVGCATPADLRCVPLCAG
jgi:hypothetical protein